MNETATLAFETWRKGYGLVVHQEPTVERVATLAASGRIDPATLYRVLAAADRLTSAAMWTVAHMTYANRVDLSGAPLPSDAFKLTPEGHTGGSLNMVPGFVGYLAANVISAKTRSWLMGQGHCVAAIEAVNALTGDVSAHQRGRYDRSEAGLSRLARALLHVRVEDRIGVELVVRRRAVVVQVPPGPVLIGPLSAELVTLTHRRLPRSG